MREEQETKPFCPACEGRGRIHTEDGTTYREVKCETCNGLGVVDRDQMRTWMAAQQIQGGSDAQ